jgi:hypothetical protein
VAARTTAVPATEFAVAPAPLWRLLWLWLPLLGVAVLLVTTHLQEQRTPMDMAITLPFLLVLGGVLSWAFLRRRITLEHGELLVTSTFYRRRTSVSSMLLEQARIVDLAEHSQFKPGMKINGFGMPGFQSGHYRMGKHKAFCLVTDPSRVLYLPLRDDRVLLLSPEHPRALLDALNAQAAR